jgi:RNA polymerase sigma factor (sigma-70 family)
MLHGTTSLEQAYRVHAPSVHRRARALLGSDAEAWEVVQDVFLSLHEQPRQFGGRSRLSTFLYSATTHACLNRIRSQKNRARLLDHRAPEVPMPSSLSSLDPEALSLLHDSLRRLPEQLSATAVYYYVDDLSQDDIAELLGCSRKHVGHLLARLEQAVRALEVSC